MTFLQVATGLLTCMVYTVYTYVVLCKELVSRCEFGFVSVYLTLVQTECLSCHFGLLCLTWVLVWMHMPAPNSNHTRKACAELGHARFARLRRFDLDLGLATFAKLSSTSERCIVARAQGTRAVLQAYMEMTRSPMRRTNHQQRT